MSRWARLFSGSAAQQFLTSGAERLSHIRPVVFLKAGAAGLLFTTYGASVVLCAGPSMLPSICSGDILVVDKVSHRFLGKSITNGDIVVCTSPESRGKTVAKRICGVEGQVVHTSAWKSPTGRSMQQTVPPGHVWIEGDNWEVSYDSRQHGPIPLKLVRGRANFRIWPPARFGRVPARPAGTDPLPAEGREQR